MSVRISCLVELARNAAPSPALLWTCGGATHVLLLGRELLLFLAVLLLHAQLFLILFCLAAGMLLLPACLFLGALCIFVLLCRFLQLCCSTFVLLQLLVLQSIFRLHFLSLIQGRVFLSCCSSILVFFLLLNLTLFFLVFQAVLL